MARPARKSWRLKAPNWVLAGAAALLAVSLFVRQRHLDRWVAPADVLPVPVAVVFGAGLAGDAPSPVLAERLDTAFELYRTGKVKELLVSGDSVHPTHRETQVMARYLQKKGLPQEALRIDRAGVSTFDTLLRARDVFGVRRVVLVTQSWHLPRALFVAGALGLDAQGVAADAADRHFVWAQEARELVSRLAAAVEVLPHLGR